MRARAGPDASVCLANTRGCVSLCTNLRHWPHAHLSTASPLAHQIITHQPIVFIPDPGARTAWGPWAPELTTRRTIAGTASTFVPVASLSLRRAIPQ
jgi:hypothetical protein